MEIDGEEINRRHRTESNERDQAYPSIHTTRIHHTNPYNWNQSWYLELPLLACIYLLKNRTVNNTNKQLSNNTQNMYQQSMATIVQTYFSYRIIFFGRNHLKSQMKKPALYTKDFWQYSEKNKENQYPS